MYLLSRWVEGIGIQKKRTFLVLCQIHTSVTELCCVKNGHENDFHGVGNWFYESTKHTREGTRDGGGGELKNLNLNKLEMFISFSMVDKNWR